MSYPAIADALGVSLPTAYKYVERELERLARERRMEGEKVLEMELARLDKLTLKCMGAAEKGSLDHMEMVLKLMDRRAKLLGLNAPVRHEHAVTEQRKLPDVELYNRTRALLLRLQAAGHNVGGRLLELDARNALPGEVVSEMPETAKEPADSRGARSFEREENITSVCLNDSPTITQSGEQSAPELTQSGDE